MKAVIYVAAVAVTFAAVIEQARSACDPEDQFDPSTGVECADPGAEAPELGPELRTVAGSLLIVVDKGAKVELVTRKKDGSIDLATRRAVVTDADFQGFQQTVTQQLQAMQAQVNASSSHVEARMTVISDQVHSQLANGQLQLQTIANETSAELSQVAENVAVQMNETVSTTMAELSRVIGGAPTTTSSGAIIAPPVFCAAWGGALRALTGKDNCELPRVWNADITLEGWMIPLVSEVEIVNGFVTINGQHYLESLGAVFPKLRIIYGDFTVQSCNGLVDVASGMQRLEFVDGTVKFHQNPSVEVFANAFPSLVNVSNGVKLDYMHGIKNFSGAFPALVKTGGDAYVAYCNGLTSIDMLFPALVETGGNAYVRNCDGVTSVDRLFPALVSTGGNMGVYSMQNMVRMEGIFPMLTSMSLSNYLYMNGNSKMAEVINVFPSLTSAGKVRLQSNTAWGGTMQGTSFQSLVTVERMYWYNSGANGGGYDSADAPNFCNTIRDFACNRKKADGSQTFYENAGWPYDTDDCC